MQRFPIVNCVEEFASLAKVGSSTIRCYLYPPLMAAAFFRHLSPDRELAAQAMTLLLRLDADLREARTDWNVDASAVSCACVRELSADCADVG